MSEVKIKWDLEKYYFKDLDDPKVKETLDKVKVITKEFVEKYKGKIKYFEADDFLDFFKDDDVLTETIYKVGFYFSYLSSLDTQNQEVLKKEGEYSNLMTEISNELLFISQEFKEIGYEKLIELSKNLVLKDYENYFVQKAFSVKFLLDEKTEFALNLKSNSGNSAFVNLYEELVGSFLFKINVDGKEKEITEEELRSYALNPKEDLRKASVLSSRKVYGKKQNQITLGNTYAAVVKNWTSEVKLRGYSSVLGKRNVSEELDDETVNLLLEEVENAYPLYHKFLEIEG